MARRSKHQQPLKQLQARQERASWRQRQLARWTHAGAVARTRCSPVAAAIMYALVGRAHRTPGKVAIGYGGRWRCGQCRTKKGHPRDCGRRDHCPSCKRTREEVMSQVGTEKEGLADLAAGKRGRSRSSARRGIAELLAAGLLVRLPGSELGGRMTGSLQGHAAEYMPAGGEAEAPPAPPEEAPVEGRDPVVVAAGLERLRAARRATFGRSNAPP